MHQKTMKDYIQGITPLTIKNAIIKCKRVKRKLICKRQSCDTSSSLNQKLCDLYKEHESLKSDHIPTISRKNARKFLAEKILDLHGYTREKAIEALYDFLEQCKRENIRNVLIITGGSAVRKSVIRSLFRQWVHEYFSKYISAYGHASASSGGEGAFYVILKNQT
ncbi:hypothetical protein FACS189449_11840 [Alphaproteobacteria bacterium]|nr:hypothetical protein FACS189449_11840 [Alphaproteobacteria bacterium]